MGHVEERRPPVGACVDDFEERLNKSVQIHYGPRIAFEHESTAVNHVHAAGKDPRFWAAEMTYLERKSPDRWARRAEDSTTPRVVVQIGIATEEIKVTLDAASAESDAILPQPPASPTVK